MSLVLQQPITAGGGTFNLDPTLWPAGDVIVRLYAATPIAMAGDVIVQLASDPQAGTKLTIEWAGGDFTLGIYSFAIPGVGLAQLQLDYTFSYVYDFIDSAGSYHRWTTFETTNIKLLGSAILQDGSVTLAKLENLTNSHLIVGSGSNIPTSVAVTGDVTISNSGVTAISAGVIVNADINASAAIAVTKLAALTASSVVKTDASGFLTTTGADIVNADVNASAAIALSKLAALTASKPVVTTAGGVLATANQISAAFGGTGIDGSAATGVVTVLAGTYAIGARTEVMHLQVSFETGYLGDFKITMPFAGTVTSIYAYATKVIAGTDAGTIQMKNNGGTSTTGGLITYAASDARGTAYTATPTANNTFAAADILTFTTAKTTAGGVVQLSITYTRTN